MVSLLELKHMCFVAVQQNKDCRPTKATEGNLICKYDKDSHSTNKVKRYTKRENETVYFSKTEQNRIVTKQFQCALTALYIVN